MFHFDRYLFRSGNTDHPGDLFHNTTIEILTTETLSQSEIQSIASRAGLSRAEIDETSEGFIPIGRFNEDGLAQGEIPDGVGAIRTLRIHVHEDSDSWVILSEVSKYGGFCNCFPMIMIKNRLPYTRHKHPVTPRNELISSCTMQNISHYCLSEILAVPNTSLQFHPRMSFMSCVHLHLVNLFSSSKNQVFLYCSFETIVMFNVAEVFQLSKPDIIDKPVFFFLNIL